MRAHEEEVGCCEAFAENSLEVGDVAGPVVGFGVDGVEGVGDVVYASVPPFAADAVVFVAVFTSKVDREKFPGSVRLEFIRICSYLAREEDVVFLQDLGEYVGV